MATPKSRDASATDARGARAKSLSSRSSDTSRASEKTESRFFVRAFVGAATGPSAAGAAATTARGAS